MHRPYVQANATNLLPQLRQHLDTQLVRLKSLAGVVGVTLNGGMSRGYADRLSEIDVTLYLEATTYASWQMGNSPLPYGICMLDGMLYDIKVVDLDAEQQRDWEDDARWDASYAEVLHDPTGRVAELLRDKIGQFPSPEDAGGSLFQCWWYFRLAADIWILREDALQGHQMLNQAVTALIKAIFIANREFVPHEKWAIHLSRSLRWTPAGWPERLAEAMQPGDFTIDSLRHRQTRIEALWDEVDGYVRRDLPSLPVRVMQKSVYDLLAMLIAQERVTTVTWQSVATMETLNHAPFFGITRIEGDSIVLDREKLLNLGPEQIYAWHYEVVRVAVAQDGGR